MFDIRYSLFIACMAPIADIGLPYSRPQNPYRNPSNWSKIALTLLIGKADGSWIT
jgi:hypothetical protein